MYGNQDGKKIFNIPVEWVVTENIEIKADTLEEAVNFILDNTDTIPCGDEPAYVDGTWRISADENNTGKTSEICSMLECYGYTERQAEEYDEVEDL